MSFFKRYNSADDVSLLNVTEIARTALYNRQSHGWTYREGVIEESVRLARHAKTQNEVVDAIESAFTKHELPRSWTLPCGSLMDAIERLGVLGCEII